MINRNRYLVHGELWGFTAANKSEVICRSHHPYKADAGVEVSSDVSCLAYKRASMCHDHHVPLDALSRHDLV